MPNITGEMGQGNNLNINGAFYIGSGTGFGFNYNLNAATHFDASKSNPIYGKSSTVQPPSCKTVFCIKY